MSALNETLTEARDSDSNLTSILASCLTAVLYYYLAHVAQKPRLHSSNNRMLDFLQRNVKSIHDKFYPSWFSWEGRLQSMWGLALRLSESHKVPYERVILNLSDGGQLGLDVLPGKNVNDNAQQGQEKLVVLIFPGMTSSSETSYIKNISLSIMNSGCTCIIINNRGLGGVPLTTPRTYCAIIHDDIEDVLKYVKTNYPNQRILPIGTSLGGVILCNYLKYHPEEAKKNFLAAIVVSICWDPIAGSENLEKPFVNRYIVNYGITYDLIHLAKKYQTTMETKKCFDFEKILGATTIREFDTHFTAPQFGYDDVMTYYKNATIINDIEKFSIPVFGINAEDDPMNGSLPIKQAEMDGSNLAMIITARGGHLGFIDSFLPIRQSGFYLERLLGDFAKAIRLNGNELLY